MIRLWPIGLILLGFPILELWLAVVVAREIGWWLLLWLVVAAVLGASLIREQRFAMAGRLMGALQQGRDPFRAMLNSGRVILAGILLILPGLISDVIALLILVWPRPRLPQAANDEVIEAEFRREPDRRGSIEPPQN